MEGGLSKEKSLVRWAVHEPRRALRGDSKDDFAHKDKVS